MKKSLIDRFMQHVTGFSSLLYDEIVSNFLALALTLGRSKTQAIKGEHALVYHHKRYSLFRTEPFMATKEKR